jgi:hypothetical protein
MRMAVIDRVRNCTTNIYTKTLPSVFEVTAVPPSTSLSMIFSTRRAGHLYWTRAPNNSRVLT